MYSLVPFTSDETLRKALQAVANNDTKDVAILILSEDQLGVFANFLSFAEKHNLVQNLLVAAKDSTSYAQAVLHDLSVYQISDAWLNSKFTFIYDILQMGYNVLLLHPLVTFSRNPLEYIQEEPQYKHADVLLLRNEHLGVKNSVQLKAKRAPVPADAKITWVDGDLFYVRNTPA